MSNAKRFLLLTAGPVGSVPAPAGSGAAMGCWAISKMLREEGHQVTVCHLPSLNYRPTPEETANLGKKLAALAALKVPIEFVQVPYAKRKKWQQYFDACRGAVRPRLAEFYPWVLAKPAVSAIIERWRPDAIYHMATYTLPLSEGDRRPPRLVMTGDMDDVLLYYQWRMTPVYLLHKFSYKMFKWLAARRLNDVLMPMMEASESVITGAHHTTAMLRRYGVKHQYLPNPWATNATEPVCLQPVSNRSDPRPRVLMIGHLAGTATLYGLYFLARAILPQLDRRLGQDGFVIEIVGRDALPGNLARRLRHPAVRLRGYVEDIHAVYRAADCLLVPTPVVTGARTRIAEAFGFGACVVAHASEAVGMPEIVNESNALLADTGAGLAEAVVRVHGDPGLRRRLGEAARRTYETFYSPDKAIARIVAELRRIAGVNDHG